MPWKFFNASGSQLTATDNVTVAALADGTDGELITWDTAGAPATVAVGTSGHVLTSGGTGVAPTFQAAAVSSLANGTDGELITWNASGAPATVAVGTINHVLTSGGTGVAPTFQAAAAAGIASVVADTSPELGGNLDMQANLLVGNGGSTGIAISVDGEVTMAAQPAFAAHQQANVLNVTGAGTLYTPVLFPNQVYDVGGDWAESPGSTFTAPVTGKYVLTSSVRIWGQTTAMTYGLISLVTSNRIWNVYTSTGDVSVTSGWFISAVADMDATDTCYVTLNVFGESGDTIDIAGSMSMSISFSGVLVA